MGRFHTIIGTGGIGTGTLWYLADDRILGRNESRSAVLSDARDYCKQHIILHYLGVALSGETQVWAIGKVGDDAAADRILREMQDACIDTACVERDPNSVTMQSVCLQYPDHSVCNVTTSNSASAQVDAAYMHQCLKRLPQLDQGSLVLAATEVPLEARIALLEAGREYGAYCVASVLCEETSAFSEHGGLELCDLLIINQEEAAALFHTSETDLERLVSAVQQQIPDTLTVIVTLGKDGSLAIDRNQAAQKSGQVLDVASTAGAGDAFTAGVICGLHFGHDLFGKAMEFGSFFAGRSVTCKHTIDPSITRDLVLDFAAK